MKRRQSQAQLDNLKKGVRITKETASEYGKKGQPASLLARKKRQDLATITSAVGDRRIKEEDLIQTLEGIGVTDEHIWIWTTGIISAKPFSRKPKI